MLFDASQLRPPISPAVNLAEPGPRAATRLWAALLESLILVDASVSACSLARCDLVAACRSQRDHGSASSMDTTPCLPPKVGSCKAGLQATADAPGLPALQAAAREGRRAAELAAALPAHLKRSLLFEVESSGLK